MKFNFSLAMGPPKKIIPMGMSHSHTRTIYDQCAYTKRVEESTSPLAYLLNPIAYQRCDKCRYDFGLLGGPQVSVRPSGTLVDTENDLQGRTRHLTRCPEMKYGPKCGVKDGKCVTDSGIPYDCDTCTEPLWHLKTCPTTAWRPKVPKEIAMPAPLCAPGSQSRIQGAPVSFKNAAEASLPHDPRAYL